MNYLTTPTQYQSDLRTFAGCVFKPYIWVDGNQKYAFYINQHAEELSNMMEITRVRSVCMEGKCISKPTLMSLKKAKCFPVGFLKIKHHHPCVRSLLNSTHIRCSSTCDIPSARKEMYNQIFFSPRMTNFFQRDISINKKHESIISYFRINGQFYTSFAT